MDKKDKIIAILGETSTGKTSLGVKLAHLFHGEIISADSRQIYRGMDIGTGKDLADYCLKIPSPNLKTSIKSVGQAAKSRIRKHSTVNIRHYLIDVANPKHEFNLNKYQELAFKAIDDITGRGKLPIIVGGTGLYMQAIVDNYQLPDIKPDKKLRKKLEKMEISSLFNKLKKLNPVWTEKINESDKKNKRRIIRYFEIASQNINSGSIIIKNEPKYNALIIGIIVPKEELHERILRRLIYRLEKQDLIGEVEKLHIQGISWKRLIEFGLEYKYVSYYLLGKLDYQEMIDQLYVAIKKFAKKQATWNRRWEKNGTKINWIKSFSEAESLIKKFLK